jgi:hypothetical protein
MNCILNENRWSGHGSAIFVVEVVLWFTGSGSSMEQDVLCRLLYKWSGDNRRTIHQTAAFLWLIFLCIHLRHLLYRIPTSTISFETGGTQWGVTVPERLESWDCGNDAEMDLGDRNWCRWYWTWYTLCSRKFKGIHINQEEMIDFIRDLHHSKDQSELLSSRLQGYHPTG